MAITRSSGRRSLRIAVAALGAAAVLGACTTGSTGESAGTSTGETGTIGFLMPDTVLSRWEHQDRPTFVNAVQKNCSDCKVLTYNAQGDTQRQQSQAEAAITNGAKVLVITAVDTEAATTIVDRAKQRGVKVISYGRIIAHKDMDYGVTADPEEIGRQQARNLIDTLGTRGVKSGGLVMLNGAPTDSAAPLYKRGAHSVLDKSKYKILKEYDTRDWDPGTAQKHMEQAVTALGKDGFVGVYAGNDGLAAGAIAAMKGAGITPAKRPTTGQDAELAALQRILVGEQASTIYQPIPEFGAKAARLAINLSQGKEPPAGLINGVTKTDVKDIKAYLYKSIVITRKNIADTVVKDGFVKRSQLCTKRYEKACTKAGVA